MLDTIALPDDVIEEIIEGIDLGLYENEREYRVTIRGCTAHVPPDEFGWTKDPMWQDGSDRITKTCFPSDVAPTVARWRRMCRAIEHVSIYRVGE